jgi:hypothetical protein
VISVPESFQSINRERIVAASLRTLGISHFTSILDSLAFWAGH